MSVRSKTNREGAPPAEPERDGSELPEGWAAVRLPDVAELVMGQSPPSTTYNTEQRGLPFFQGKAEFGALYPTPHKFCDTPGKIAEPNDILMTIRAPVGPTNLCATRSCIGRGLAAIRARGEVPPLYLLYFFRSIEDWLSRQGTGSTFTAINKDDLSSIELPLAPLAEQRRIVGKLELLLGKVSSSQQRLSRVPGLLKRFRQSVLAAACSGKLTADWREKNSKVESAEVAVERFAASATVQRTRRGVPETVPVTEVVAAWEIPETWTIRSAAYLLRVGALIDLKDGNHGANHPKVSDFTDTGLPFITAAQVNGFAIDYEGAYKISGEPLSRLRVGFAKPGDVIYTHKGSVGRVAIADRDCILTPQTTYYRVAEQLFDKKFVMYFLASPSLVEQVAGVKEQTTRDFVPISEQYLLFHRIPPLAEQQEIVRRVEKLFAFADQIEARLKQAQTHVDRLTQSLLAKAFRGELVPTEHALATAAIREYETAPALLARIRLNHDDQQKIVRTPDKKPAPATNKQPRKQKVTRQ